jgi:hypothetical protein
VEERSETDLYIYKFIHQEPIEKCEQKTN